MDVTNKYTQQRSLNVVGLVKKFLSQLRLWVQNYQTRKQLARLSEDRLQDIGLNREQVKIECARPFWR